MDSYSGNVEVFEEETGETHLIAVGRVEKARYTDREPFQEGRVYELSECLVARPVGRLYIRNFANLQAGWICKFTIDLIGPKTLSP
jgi:hypothetical protein